MEFKRRICNIGDTRSPTDFQFPRCRTIKLQSANTISTAAPRENEYSKVASLKSKCQSALRRRRTEERKERNEMKKIFDPVASSMTTDTSIYPFSKCPIDDKWSLDDFYGLIANRIEKRERKKNCETRRKNN